MLNLTINNDYHEQASAIMFCIIKLNIQRLINCTLAASFIILKEIVLRWKASCNMIFLCLLECFLKLSPDCIVNYMNNIN